MSSFVLQAVTHGDRLLLEKALNSEFGPVEPRAVEDALLKAATHGEAECVARLLAEGADVNCEDTDGDTPLMMAASNNHLRVVKLLLAAKCDLNQVSDRGRTALHMAVWHGHMRIVNILLCTPGCDVNIRDHYGDTPIMLCASKGLAEFVDPLLAKGSDLTIRSKEKDSALHYAARKNNAAVLRQLVATGMSLDLLNMWRHTPLYVAVSCGHTDAALVLVYAGADVHLLDRTGRTPLHLAAQHNMLECVETLLAFGARADVKDDDGCTALSRAVKSGHRDCVRLLLQYGCDIHTLHTAFIQGKRLVCSLLELAMSDDDLDIADLLLAAGAGSRDLQALGLDSPLYNDHVLVWIAERVLQPHSLAGLCRTAIHDILETGLPIKVGRLPLPRPLQDFLAFRDLADDH